MNIFNLSSLMIFFTIWKNKVKIIYILLIIISYNIAGTFSNNVVKYNVVEMVKHNGEYIYLTYDRYSDDYKIDTYSTNQNIKDNILVKSEYSGHNILWYVLLIASSILLIATLIISINDDDLSWGFKSCMLSSILFLTKTEYIDGIYYYICCGKLLGKRDYQINRTGILYEFGISGFLDIRYCPKFKISK